MIITIKLLVEQILQEVSLQDEHHKIIKLEKTSQIIEISSLWSPCQEENSHHSKAPHLSPGPW